MSGKSKYFISSDKVFAVSKIFQHGKTQIPRDVRHALRLKDGDKLIWYSKDDGTMYVKPVE